MYLTQKLSETTDLINILENKVKNPQSDLANLFAELKTIHKETKDSLPTVSLIAVVCIIFSCKTVLRLFIIAVSFAKVALIAADSFRSVVTALM